MLEAARAMARRFIGADMQAIAEQSGSVISASLFGALAGSGALPFATSAFEDTIRASGIGVAGSLRAFAAGSDAVTAQPAAPAPAVPGMTNMQGGTAAQRAALAAILERIRNDFPTEAHDMLRHGVARLVDYQDVAYAQEYLSHAARVTALHTTLALEAARQIAVAMAYDDVIRVADLKTRGDRIGRIRGEVRAAPDQLVATTEFFHPRVAEICATMPARLGAWVEASPRAQAVLRRLFERGRRVRTTTLGGFLPLYALAGLRRWRRRLLRHQREQAHLHDWLALVTQHAPTDPALALEILMCRRLVKGYSDTHERGTGKFDRVLSALPVLANRPDAAAWLRRLREAALADAAGTQLDGTLATVRSL